MKYRLFFLAVVFVCACNSVTVVPIDDEDAGVNDASDDG